MQKLLAKNVASSNNFEYFCTRNRRTMVSKTREKLIEVARQLFLKKGVENTTMNDIAAASEKGRRTIYTYFKNKREIYNAVIEQQSEMIVHELRNVTMLDLPPLEKLERYLQMRFRIVDDITTKSERSSRYFFRGEHRRFAKVMRMAMDKEVLILRSVLDEGVRLGAFDPRQAQRLPSLEVMLYQGVESAMQGESLPADRSLDSLRNDIIAFIIEGIKLKNQ